MTKAIDFYPFIPDGFRTYAHLTVAGIQHRKEAAFKFANGSMQSLELEQEPTNKNDKNDKNAIKVIGIFKGLLFLKREFMGYVPKDCAKQIIESRILAYIKPCLTRIYAKDREFIEIQFNIIGPEEHKKTFSEVLKNRPVTQS